MFCRLQLEFFYKTPKQTTIVTEADVTTEIFWHNISLQKKIWLG